MAEVFTLVLVRHGKSSYPEGVDDHDRPLSDRGAVDAETVGRAIASSAATAGGSFDLALVSSATRAQQTWDRAGPSLTVAAISTDPTLYLTDAADLLHTVHQLPTAARRVVIVGHNNGLEDLAAALSATSVVLKTSTFAVLRSDRPWPEWGPGTAELVEVVVAR